MSYPSDVAPYPVNSAYIFALLAFACSYSSKTIAPPPPAIINPSLSASYGLDAFSGVLLYFDDKAGIASKYNSTPEKASRPYDADRDGFIIAGGGGAIVLEEYEHAKARRAKIYAELTGYGATSDGYDMVQPSGEGAVRCMNMALKTTKNKVDYINSHGTSTPIGDLKELEAIEKTFKENIPKISSTKSLTGHSLGATGVQEAIYCLLMMKNKFISASANIENMDEKAKNFPIVTKIEKNKELNCTMSNSFGFGGTNATLIFEKLN
jgi:3-oxoacyl-[acyl-carrier-protein] synthase-1